MIVDVLHLVNTFHVDVEQEQSPSPLDIDAATEQFQMIKCRGSQNSG